MPDLPRLLMVLLKEYGPLCERCLAHRAGMTVSRVATVLKSLRQSVAVRVEHGECPGSGESTQTFSPAKTHEDADVVTRTAPGDLRGRGGLLCPVCLMRIEPKHSVTIDHGEVVHADWGSRP